MANSIIIDKVPEEYMIKSLGSGVSAECFLTSDEKVFKKYHNQNGISYLYNTLRTKDYYKSDIFIFPETYVFMEKEIPENFIGYLMKYIEGYRLSELESSILIRDLIDSVRIIEEEIRRLTFQGLMFNDLNQDNIMFRTISDPKVIDTDLYEGTYNDMFGDMFKENIRELAETIISSVIGINDLESNKMNEYINQCAYYGMMLPSLLMRELLEYVEDRLQVSISTYGEYKSGLTLLKKKN